MQLLAYFADQELFKKHTSAKVLHVTYTHFAMLKTTGCTDLLLPQAEKRWAPDKRQLGSQDPPTGLSKVLPIAHRLFAHATKQSSSRCVSLYSHVQRQSHGSNLGAHTRSAWRQRCCGGYPRARRPSSAAGANQESRARAPRSPLGLGNKHGAAGAARAALLVHKRVQRVIVVKVEPRRGGRGGRGGRRGHGLAHDALRLLHGLPRPASTSSTLANLNPRQASIPTSLPSQHLLSLPLAFRSWRARTPGC